MKGTVQYKRLIVFLLMLVCLGWLAMPQALMAGKGFMGGKGKITVKEEPADTGGIPDTVEGPLNDKMSDQGKLFGDLYKILRYQGGETKQVPAVDDLGDPIFNDDGLQELVSGDNAIGGEPVLSEGYAEYALEIDEGVYELATAPFPSQCVQPVADYAKWGPIGSDFNRLPLVMTYDATWKRTECEVGRLLSREVNEDTGAVTDIINQYFIPPCDEESESNTECTWEGVVYCDGVLWADMVDEVHFGRLNLSRSPEAVLQAAFDEAITTINSATSISRDAAGRLLLTRDIYEEIPTGIGETCGYTLIETITKAIDSPLENLALYVKLIQDGHLVTPGDERAPIDRSERGGIPLWKMLELSDGPSDALRPTVDIEKLSEAGFSNLVDVSKEDYFTYYECYTDAEGSANSSTPCLCIGENHDGAETVVACENVVSRKLLAVDTCPEATTIPDTIPNSESCDIEPWRGIRTDDLDNAAKDEDFDFAAAFLSAAADKTGEIGPDMVVYINSILGINKVVGYSDYNSDGTPADDAVDYSVSPVYYNFGRSDGGLFGYDRYTMVGGRGNAGFVTVLRDLAGTGQWSETPVDMLGGAISFRDKGIDSDTGAPNGGPAVDNILGFTQMADDDLNIIEFIHTYQIPGLR